MLHYHLHLCLYCSSNPLFLFFFLSFFFIQTEQQTFKYSSADAVWWGSKAAMSSSRRHSLQGDCYPSIWNYYFLFPMATWCLGNWGFSRWAGESDANLLICPSRRRINAPLNCRHGFLRLDAGCLVFSLHILMVNEMMYIKGRWQCYLCRWRALMKQRAGAGWFSARTARGVERCPAVPYACPSDIPHSVCLPGPTGHPAVYLSIASHESGRYFWSKLICNYLFQNVLLGIRTLFIF